MKSVKNENHLLASAWIVLGVLARLLPFPANVSPLTSISLFGGSEMGRARAFVMTLVTLVLSDILLAAAFGYPVFGTWTFFTYTGFAAIVWAGGALRGKTSAPRVIGMLLGSSVGFWLWTNFGVWATSEGGMYPQSFAGLVACYTAAIPFLRNALLGDLAWGFVFFAGFAAVKNFAPRFHAVKA
jgi:hypothetical protein